jgi:fatty acid desaturase
VSRKGISCALNGATWTALGVAFVGALATPRNYCYYEGVPHPTAEIVVMVALAAALFTQVAAIVLMAVGEWTLRESAVSVGSAVAAVVAGVWIVWLTHQHVLSWGCG